MKLISFDAFRTLGLPVATSLKPEHMNNHIDQLLACDGVLFPQYWQLNPLVYGLKRKVFPSLATYHIGHDKVEMTRCFQMVASAHVPWTEIAANTDYEAERLWNLMPIPFVAKIPRSSMGEGVFLIEQLSQWREYCRKSPVLYVQEYLPIDRDLRIVWVGKQVVGGYWRIQAEQGFYNNLARGGHAEQGIMPEAALELVARLATALEINHGGFDIAMVAGHPYVLEFNRIFGNQGIPELQQKVDAAIVEYLGSSWIDHDPQDPSSPKPNGGPGYLRAV
ncbi:ATP-grasp domain-containing protein [Oceanobacter mangrovi]|uniref:ATP-grasp domain-containing protein n=1 Tax=Oceanobacter mangrovi TaxID=2862510 RepID=UPI001C8D6A0A|nr:hypothetical protein [Oceanobacter mangrovi]